MQIIDNVINLFYPKICLACSRKLLPYEEVICTYCDARLPKTGFHKRESNPVEILFWGRCDLESAAAFYRYLKEGRVQNLIHNFKYKGYQEIGTYIGEKYGKQLIKTERFKTVDIIIPVPLHPKRQRRRGFNQSEVFGKGLSKGMKVKQDISILLRNVNTETQTKKSRWERHKNVSDIFIINNQERLQGKHVLLIDDVITTGSTIEACANALSDIEGVKVSVVAIATAAH